MALIKFDGYDDALVGIADAFNEHGCIYERLVYSGDRIVEILMFRDGMSMEDAMEFIDYNLNIGPDTPIVVWQDFDSLSLEDEEE